MLKKNEPRGKAATPFLLLSFLIFVAPLFAYASEGENPNRFLGVERWIGTITTQTSEESMSMPTDCISTTPGPASKASELYRAQSGAHFFVNLPVIKPDPNDSSTGGVNLRWGSGEGGAFGSGSFNWSENSHRSCPENRKSFTASGSRTTGDIAAWVTIMVTPEITGYSISTQDVDVKGSTQAYSYFKKAWVDKESCDREGNCKITSTILDPKAVKALDIVSARSGMGKPPTGEKRSPASRGVGSTHDLASSSDKNPFPKTGMVLAGHAEAHWQTKDVIQSAISQTVTWNLFAEGRSDFEAEVEIEGYEHWVPKADYNLKEAGDYLVIHVRILNKKTGKPEKRARVKKYSFNLLNTSRQPGSAMNFPWPSEAKKDPDFKFEAERNDTQIFTVKENGQTMETRGRKGGYDSESLAIVSSFDWGGWTDLVVQVDLDGVPIVAHLKGDRNKKIIPVPKRKNTSHIADAWKEDRGIQDKKDSDDDEDVPAGDEHKGDGLTLYEEYRGFYTHFDVPGGQEGKHFYGDPLIKDVFIQDDTGIPETRKGIALYEDLTNFRVRKITEFDVEEDRLINFNAGNIPNHNPQYVIRLRKSPGMKSYGGTASAVSTPHIAGNVRLAEIIFSPEWRTGRQTVGDRGTADSYAETVAHETLHSSAVPHHGTSDLAKVEWKSEQDAAGIWHIYERKYKVTSAPDGTTTEDLPKDAAGKLKPGKIIRVFDEATNLERPGNYYSYPNMPFGAVDAYVANQHGQHSGVEHCVMRYSVASAYDPTENGSNIRFEIDSSKEGLGPDMGRFKGELCSTSKASGMTALRYGNAKYGNCRGRICVNDRFLDNGKHYNYNYV